MPIQKILIVDDSKTELMFLSDLLVKNGFTVRTAENAEDAFRRLAEEKPDLILMDVVMPGQNGFQLTRAVSRDPQFADVPIIMCTSKNQETDLPPMWFILILTRRCDTMRGQAEEEGGIRAKSDQSQPKPVSVDAWQPGRPLSP